MWSWLCRSLGTGPAPMHPQLEIRQTAKENHILLAEWYKRTRHTGIGLTFMMSASLKTRFVIVFANMNRSGKTRPHSAMMPYGSGSSMSFVISNPVMSSTVKSAPRTCGHNRTHTMKAVPCSPRTSALLTERR